MHGDAWPRDPVEIAAAWRRAFFKGRVEALDWLMTRTFTGDLGGSRLVKRGFDREGLLAFSQVLSQAFPNLQWKATCIEQREHEVLVDAAVAAKHEGPLDLTPFGGREYEATERSFVLPLQRFAWDIAHERVHRMEVVRGPGLGPEAILDALRIEDASPLEQKRQGSDDVSPRDVPVQAGVVRFQSRPFVLHEPLERGNGKASVNGSSGNGAKAKGSKGNGTNGNGTNGNGSNGNGTNGNGSNGDSVNGNRTETKANGRKANGASEGTDGSARAEEEGVDPAVEDLRARIDEAIRDRARDRSSSE